MAASLTGRVRYKVAKQASHRVMAIHAQQPFPPTHAIASNAASQSHFAIRHPPSAIRHPPSAIRHPPS
ncbi:hypothetical protein, partial [Xanthomonas oryzae]